MPPAGQRGWLQAASNADVIREAIQRHQLKAHSERSSVLTRRVQTSLAGLQARFRVCDGMLPSVRFRSKWTERRYRGSVDTSACEVSVLAIEASNRAASLAGGLLAL